MRGTLSVFVALALGLSSAAWGSNRIVFDAVLDDDAAALEAELDRGADAQAKASRGCAALLAAATLSKIEILKFLLTKRSVDVDCRNDKGMTALMVSADGGNAAIARLLLEHGADRELKDDEGQTALSLAKAGLSRKASTELKALGGGRHSEVVRLLQSNVERWVD